MAFYGDPKVGKSYAALQMACALTEGKDWFGFHASRKCKVVYIQLDTPRNLWAERLDEIRESYPIVDDIYFADLGTLDLWPFDVMNPDHAGLLSNALLEIKPDVVIVDTFRESHSLDENSNTDIPKVVAQLTRIVQPAALVVVSHAKKPSREGGPDLINDMRGASYIAGRMDAIIRFTKKSAHFVGRALEEGTMRLERLENGFWVPQLADVDALIADCLANNPGASQRQIAALMSERLNKTEDACRSLLQRYLKRHPPK